MTERSSPWTIGVARPFRDQTINCLKHRLLTFLFKRAYNMSQESGNAYELRKFYQYFDQVSNFTLNGWVPFVLFYLNFEVVGGFS